MPKYGADMTECVCRLVIDCAGTGSIVCEECGLSFSCNGCFWCDLNDETEEDDDDGYQT